METSKWCLMEAVSGQIGITVSSIQHIIPVYLNKNSFIIIITTMYNLFQSLNVITKIVIVFIHSWLVSVGT